MDTIERYLHKNVILRLVPVGSAGDVRRALGKQKPAAGFVIAAGEEREAAGVTYYLEFSMFDGPELSVGTFCVCQLHCSGLPNLEGTWLVERTNRLSERSLIVRMQSPNVEFATHEASAKRREFSG